MLMIVSFLPPAAELCGFGATKLPGVIYDRKAEITV